MISQTIRRVLTGPWAILNDGGLVAFPTETVYGLACRADMPQAVERLYQAKGRPAAQASTVHIGQLDQAARYVPDLSVRWRRLLKRAWPGPLTAVIRLDDDQMRQVRQTLDDAVVEALYVDQCIGSADAGSSGGQGDAPGRGRCGDCTQCQSCRGRAARDG